ncbi:hypothetical protein NPX13_g4849 [Xylaria arbuscula]|uniref:AAA+ ATPase domain-containing protein n=1 Tax=Xylaria arbuscula TaxID=114810 RepID=A0A9W8NFJ6_9PEZI|nr:hypothetical protein NPX13_g4849 [Xylaria arbuscula]
MDGTWVHTLEDGLEPVSLSNRPPAPAPKPQRFQSVRISSGRPRFQDRTTPRRNSALYGAQDLRHLDNGLHGGNSSNQGFGDLSLVDPHNRLQKLENMLSRPQPEEESRPIQEVVRESVQTLETSEDPMLSTKPMTRDCNWEQFKNRFPDETETFAIEVLLAQDDLAEQIEADQLRRLKPEDRKAFESNRRRSRQPRGRKRVESVPIARVRINSAIILGYLSKVTGDGPWVEKSHTFLAPFNLFLHFHNEMEKEFQILEENFRNGDANGPSVSGLGDSNEFDFLGNRELQGLMKSRRAYAEMKCYVDFVKTRLIPRRNMFANAGHARPSKVSYRDLASLFQPGDLVIEPGTSQSENRIRDKRSSVINVTEPKLWKVCYVSEDTPNWSVQSLDAPGAQLQSRIDLGDEATHLRLYYIDFDGQRFSPVRGDVSIEAFDGEREITKLPIYPLRFHKDHESLLKELQDRGQKFRDIVSSGNSTLSYHGWTLTKDPSGRDIAARPGQEGSVWPEYIESDVIVDFNEAFQVYPWWKPAFRQFPGAESFYPTTTRDEFPIVEWSDRSRFREFASREEMVVEYDGVRELEWANFIETDAFVGQGESSEPLGHLTQTLGPDDLALLPSRLFVYALRSRGFINADIRYLKPVRDTQNPLESLQLPEKHKDMIQSAVFGHLEKKKVRRRATLLNSEFLDQDLIHGKGRGLAVLLHGPPGVGKTATAEAIAYLYKKPLFPITSSDLGTDPWDVETKLSEIFRLANLWDCILLLDEAETLLAQRDKKDNNQKSSLVSVFLRTLEYYSGILFLTTNRPDVMDDAVKSRVQVSLQYPRLGLIETLAIFQTNLDRLIDIEFERAKITGETALEVRSDSILAFAAAHYHRHEGNAASPPWNGRQIRNAFQIAPSIARYGRRQSDNNNNGAQASDQEPYVGPEHFEKVEESTTESETAAAAPVVSADKLREA